MATDTLTPLAELKNLIVFAEEVHASLVQVDLDETAKIYGNPSITKALRLPEVVEELERRLSDEQLKGLRLGDPQELAGQIPLDQHRAIFFTISLQPDNYYGVNLPSGERQSIWLHIELDAHRTFEL